MRSYICYVHTPAAMTPHMRVVTVAAQEDFTKAIKDLLEQWPRFELIDVYDETDRLVLRMAADEAVEAQVFNPL
jgi:hypothetical protein